MNITEASAKLFTFFSPEERPIPDSVTYPGRNAAVRDALNAALQDLFGKGKKWVRNEDRGAKLYAPTTVSMAVTEGNTAATMVSWASWMEECSIVIEGADVDNRIQAYASGNITLQYPYTGNTGTRSAVVYCDSINLGTDVLEVHDPIKVDRRPLSPISSPATETSRPRNIEDYGFHTQSGRPVFEPVSATGRIQGYSVETYSPNANTPPRVRIRFSPAPTLAAFAEYSVMLCPPRVSSLTATDELPIPFAFVESIFIPIAIKKLRGCPFWRGTMADEEVEAGYQNALALLNEGNPRKTQGFRFTAPY